MFKLRILSLYSPAWVRVCSPCPSYAICLFVNSKVIKSKLVFHFVPHGYPGGTGTNDYGGLCHVVLMEFEVVRNQMLIKFVSQAAISK